MRQGFVFPTGVCQNYAKILSLCMYSKEHFFSSSTRDHKTVALTGASGEGMILSGAVSALDNQQGTGLLNVESESFLFNDIQQLSESNQGLLQFLRRSKGSTSMDVICENRDMLLHPGICDDLAKVLE